METNKNITLRIKAVRKHLGMTQDQFAGQIGYSQGQVSDAEKGKIPISDKFIRLICSETGASYKYIRSGEGEMFENQKPTGNDILELTEIAKRVLQSNTHYASSLAANIISFDKGLKSEQDHEQRIARLEKKGGSIRADDPVEKKDELLKLRTV
jgi:transcriptional regulator with XRE-family HTH domain